MYLYQIRIVNKRKLPCTLSLILFCACIVSRICFKMFIMQFKLFIMLFQLVHSFFHRRVWTGQWSRFHRKERRNDDSNFILDISLYCHIFPPLVRLKAYIFSNAVSMGQNCWPTSNTIIVVRQYFVPLNYTFYNRPSRKLFLWTYDIGLWMVLNSWCKKIIFKC